MVKRKHPVDIVNDNFEKARTKPCIPGEDWARGYNDGIMAGKNITLGMLKDGKLVIHCNECKHAVMTYYGQVKYCKFWQADGNGDPLYLSSDFYCACAELKE